jgi:hypothetical protein
MFMNYIVTTTINPPTEALIKFSQFPDWKLVVVGDKKTPHEPYKDLNCKYLSPEYQEHFYKDVSDLIGWNCIQRRNIGFLYAYEHGAEYVASADDDNIPYERWGRIYLDNVYAKEIVSKEICVDPITHTQYWKLWHRGFPIQLVDNRKGTEYYNAGVWGNFHVQANFWDGDPDVDAICRLMYAPECKFNPNDFPFFTHKFTPFNSQNTILKREVLKHYFMLPFIGRMDDIWAAYYVESLGYKVVYGEATVYQKRNVHNLGKDLENEILGYTKTLDLLYALKDNPKNLKDFVPTRTWEAFQCYQGYFSG